MARTSRTVRTVLALAVLLVAAAFVGPAAQSAVSANVAYVFDFGSGVNDTDGPGTGSGIFVNAVTGSPIGVGDTGTYNGATFTNVPVSTIDSSPSTALNGFDTVILYEVCDIAAHPATLTAINNFLASGGKVMIFDADRCSGEFGEPPPADYSGFLFPFTANTPGPVGAGGSYTEVEASTLTAGLPSAPPPVGIPGDAVGDANIFTSSAGGWCESIKAVNTNNVEGFVQAYARTSAGGLVIYDGEDFWFTFGPTSHLKTVFDDMLAQTFNPDSLPCTIPATGIKLEPPTQTHFVNGSATVTATVVDSNANPQSGLTVTFTVTSGPDAGATGTGVTDASGMASFTYSDTTGPGTDVLTASFTDGSGTHTSNSVNAIWVRQSTSLAYVGDVTQDYNDPANLAAVLTAGGSPVVGQLVTFTLGTQSCTATTDATGLAACSIVVNQPAGTYPLTATFAGSGAYEPASVTGTFVVTLEETTIAYTGPTVFLNGGSSTLSAVLKEDGTTPIAGRSVTLTLGTGSGAQSCTSVTNASGQASCPVSPVSQPLGPGTVTAAFAGDAFYEPATDSAPTTVFEFAPGGGAFVVGDLSATGSVTFWGAQWWKLNRLSGGPAPASFKGFAASPSIPSCGTDWSTGPGNSTPPPDGPLPSYMGVIVTSSAAKAGSTESGNTVHIIVVKTDTGYASNPGHAGTGTVVATLC